MSKKSNKPYSRCLRFLNNSSENTVKAYTQTINKFEAYHGMSIEDLVREALDEQANQVPHHLLKVIERIEDFQEYLIGEDYVYNTIHHHIQRIKTLYHKNRVEIPYIEPLNPKRARRREYIEYKDVLTKDELRQIIPLMRLPAQARAMTMIQAGLSNEECEHLTLTSFIDETYKYHQCTDIVDALKWLADENHPIIWVTKLIRVKTKKPYYAIIGAEAVNTIASAKLYELGLPSNHGAIPEKLLTNHKISFNKICVTINNRLGLGKVAEENKLKPHNLRRFHATYIRGSALSYEDNVMISVAEIDEMQGRGKTATQDTYIKTNPLTQKVLYAKVMNNLSLWHEYDYQIIDDDVHIFIVDQGVENKKLKREVEILSQKLDEKQKNSEKLNALRNELGEDTFKELVLGILNTS